MARILVVDDDPDILRLADRVLTMSGHVVFRAQDAVRAMDMLNSSLFDLLISDANMPHFSGFDLVRQVRANKRFNNMAIAMLTGLRESKDVQKAIRAGVDDYIVKPIDPMVLTQKVNELFEKKPPMEPMEIEFSEGNKLAEAKVALEVSIMTFSELGLLLRSPVEIHEGMALKIAGNVFSKLQMPPPEMKVVHCKKQREFHYEIRVDFVHVEEKMVDKIRAWIHGQRGRKVAV